PGTNATNRTDTLPTYHEYYNDAPPAYKGAPTVYAHAVGVRAVFMRMGRGAGTGAGNLAQSRMPEGLRRNTKGCGTIGVICILLTLGLALGIYFGMTRDL